MQSVMANIILAGWYKMSWERSSKFLFLFLKKTYIFLNANNQKWKGHKIRSLKGVY